MNFQPGNGYHIFNQGNNKQKVFSNDDEYRVFINLIRINIQTNCEIISWCLMPNHFHLMVYTDERILNTKKQGLLELDPLTNGIRKLLSGYARIYNSRHERSGSLFRQKTKSKCLNDYDPKRYKNQSDYFFNCFHYIHQNPFLAHLVERMEDWRYSSFRFYAGLDSEIICNKILAESLCSYDVESFIKTSYNSMPGFDF